MEIKIDLKNTTFIIPVKLDSEDRIRNLNQCISFLTRYLDTNIIIWEEDNVSKVSTHLSQDLKEKCKIYFNPQPKNYFHRTRILNEMIKLAETPVIANYDCDILLNPDNYKIAEDTILSKIYDVCYPYNGQMMDIPTKYLDYISNKFNNIDYNKCNQIHPDSRGGCFFISKEKYIESGMENEFFKSWGYEDNERYERYKKLEYKIGRLTGPLYHMSHKRNEDSDFSNPMIKNNKREFNLNIGFNKDELTSYISTWSWLKNFQ